MYLLLEVISPNAVTLGESRRKIVRHKGARIGRAPACDWVLDDPYVSKEHARITFVNGLFFVEAVGRNPVAINSAGDVIAHEEPRMLRSGDRLFIDQYEILVSIAQEEPSPALSVQDEPRFVAASENVLQVPEVLAPGTEATASQVDPLASLGIASGETERDPPAVDWQQAPVLSDHYQPPPAKKAASAIPDDWNRTHFTAPRKNGVTAASGAGRAGTPTPAAPRADLTHGPATAPPGADLIELLRAAGLPPEHLSAETLRDLGQVLRVVVEGVMAVLQARSDIKTQFRLPLTRVQASQNNPLKLSPNVETALHTLLVERNAAYLTTVKSFEDAFQDIRHHQMAMLEGVRAAFEHMLAMFSPEQLEKELQHGARRTVLGIGSTGRFKEQYAARFAALMSDPDGTFRRLFGDCFGETYEKQLEQLKAQSIAAHRQQRDGA